MNKNNIPGGDVPLSVDRLNQILKDSGLLPEVVENESIPVVADKIELPIHDKTMPDIESNLTESNEPVSISLFGEKLIPENNKDNVAVSQSVLDLFLADQMEKEKNSADQSKSFDDDIALVRDYETFLHKLSDIQLKKVIADAKEAENANIPFNDFYKNLVEEYKDNSSSN